MLAVLSRRDLVPAIWLPTTARCNGSRWPGADGLTSVDATRRRADYGPNAVRTHHARALGVLARQFAQSRAERAAEALHTSVRHLVTAIRGGAPVETDVTELVPGDVYFCSSARSSRRTYGSWRPPVIDRDHPPGPSSASPPSCTGGCSSRQSKR